MSRLHTLERSLKKPRKSQAKSRARALTVMRLEGASSRALAQHVPAKLPKDLEDQIAVVRGRAAAKPSRGLLQLEERLLGTSDAEPQTPTVQRYDHGARSPTLPMPPPEFAAPPMVRQARALSAEPPLAGSAFGGRFNVESFEETPSAPPVRVQPSDVNVSPPANTVPVMPNVPWQEPRVTTPAGAVPWAAEQQSRRESRKRTLNAEQKAVAENFQRDLAAMLGDAGPKAEAPEDKQWDNSLRSVAQPAPTPPSTNGVPQPTSAAPKPDAHEVFNQMGVAMNYANSFDLGAVNLSARFDQFERELALAPNPVPTPAAPVPVQALALDDFDLVADLAAIGGAPPMTSPATSPAGEAPSPEPVAQTTE